MKKFSTKVIEQLRYYVYLYIDPRNNNVFYIGKGNGNRVFSHLKSNMANDKVRIIRDLRRLNLEPKIEILKYGLSEKEALLVEATAIDLIDVTNLTNASRGHGAKYGARASIEEIVSMIDTTEAIINDPALLININKAFRYGMTPLEIYDATRVAWKIGMRREKAKYAMSVYRGIVREVYSISVWLESGTTFRKDDPLGEDPPPSDRWEFVGIIAPKDIREKYNGKSVAAYFAKGSQNPIKYVNCS